MDSHLRMIDAAALRVVVCGSGNGALTAAGLMAEKGAHVTIYMSPQYHGRAQALQQQLQDNHGGITINTVNVPSPSTKHGLIQGGVTTHPETAIPAADVVLISLPSPAHAALVHELAPHLGSGGRKQLLVFLPGTGGLDLMLLQQALAKQPLWQQEQVSYAASKTLPWSCRVSGPATVNIRGTKTLVDLALAPQSLNCDPSAWFTAAPMLSSLFEGTTFMVNPNLLEATLMPYNVCGNSILHPGIMYATWRDWDGEGFDEPVKFYHTATPAVVETLEGLWADAEAITHAIAQLQGLRISSYYRSSSSVPAVAPPAANDLQQHVSSDSESDDEDECDDDVIPPMVRRMRSTMVTKYGPVISNPSTLLSTMRTNAAYLSSFHPMVRRPHDGKFVPDFSARQLSEDIPYGLLPMKGVAEVLGLQTPWFDAVISWAQGKMNKVYLVDGRLTGPDVAESGAPQRFGMNTPQSLLLFPPQLLQSSRHSVVQLYSAISREGGAAPAVAAAAQPTLLAASCQLTR